MQIDFITIITGDIEQSVRFYEDILEFKLLQRIEPAPGIKIAFMGDGGENKIELIERGPVVIPDVPLVSLGFEVENMDDMREYLVEMGVKILQEPHTLSNGTRLMQAVDINGIGLGFVEEVVQEEEDLMEF
ncbi:VOC family protein [bacterium]|nr:VOC family protein [bacterium]